MLELDEANVTPAGRRTEGTEGGENLPPYSSRWEPKRAWLPWKSDGREHGLRAHRVSLGGHVDEAHDIIHQRKKPKVISSRQWKGDRF